MQGYRSIHKNCWFDLNFHRKSTFLFLGVEFMRRGEIFLTVYKVNKNLLCDEQFKGTFMKTGSQWENAWSMLCIQFLIGRSSSTANLVLVYWNYIRSAWICIFCASWNHRHTTIIEFIKGHTMSETKSKYSYSVSLTREKEKKKSCCFWLQLED